MKTCSDLLLGSNEKSAHLHLDIPSNETRNIVTRSRHEKVNLTESEANDNKSSQSPSKVGPS